MAAKLIICIAIACLALALLTPTHAGEKIVNLEIPVSCIKKLTMIDCDMNVEPPKCKTSRVVYYPPSCPIIHLEKP